MTVAALGCDYFGGEDDKELPPGASATDDLGRPLQDLELPVSLRLGDPAPSNAAKIEATTEQLRVNGEPLLTLDRGRVAEGDWQNGVIPKLEAKLRSPSRSSLAMRLQANFPYETVALILNTAKKVGINNAAFQVRQTGDSTKTGWLSLGGYVVTSKAEDLPPITAVEERSWNDFTDNWQAVFDGCRTARTGNCAYVNENFAEGGTLRSELFASGRGININFFRRGLTPEQEKEEEQARARIMAVKKEDFIQGRITQDEMVEALLLGDPSTYALFQFRYQEALTGPSALSATIGPMCHQGKRCGIVLRGDEITPLLNVVSMIGAAFPDGSQMPAFAVEMPWTERPEIADMNEWIERQSQGGL